MERLLRQTKELEKRLNLDGPQTDDQLHAWVVRNVGVDIPRTRVCEGHDAPFKFLADLYFERVHAAVLVANRGGSKTFMVAILHLLNSLYKPGCESCTIGAIENQAKRAYAHFQKLARDENGNIIKDIKLSKITETYFRNGSKLEILPGTMNSVNGPHPQKVHFDEVELADPQVYQESRQMSVSKPLANGTVIQAQDIITSTRKYAKGMMQEIVDEIEGAMHNGQRPPFQLYRWCIFETAAPVKEVQFDNRTITCQAAVGGLSEDQKCPCDKIVKGKWDMVEGKSRTLLDVCKGRFYKSGGWQPFSDVVNTFTQSDRGVWEAQQECSRPSTENLYVPEFSRETCGIIKYEPDPANGPIFMAIDFGGTNPHAVNWYQLLRYEVEAKSYLGKTIRLKEGSLVCFNEIYVAEIGNMKVAQRIIDTEQSYRRRWPRWRVQARFADPQAKAARLDFAQHEPPLRCTWHATREFEEHVKVVKDYFSRDGFYVATDKCPMFCEEIIVWRRNPNTDKQIDDFNHCMSNLRYAAANIQIIERHNQKYKGQPGSIDRPLVKNKFHDNPSVPKSSSNHPEEIKPEAWQLGFVSIHREV